MIKPHWSSGPHGWSSGLNYNSDLMPHHLGSLQCRKAREKKSIELYLQHICKCSTLAPWTPEHRALLSEHSPASPLCQTTATQPEPSVSCQEMEHIPPLSPSCSLCFLPTLLQATSGGALGNDSENETESMQAKEKENRRLSTF